MDKIVKILALIILAMLIGGCASGSEATTGAASTLNTTPPTVILTPKIATPAETPTPIPPAPTQGVQPPQTDQVIFTILNPQPWSGREGDPRPDWLGWGAETFAAAPDGTFWIADSAASPNRLLQYGVQGELLREIPLDERVIYPYHLVAAQDSLWVLDISGMQPRVVQFSTDGRFLSQVDIPPEIMTSNEMTVINVAFRLVLGEEGELLLTTIKGYYELVDAGGAAISRSLEALTYYGHTYQVGAFDSVTERLPIYVDEMRLETPENFFPDYDGFLGFNSDGSFAIAGYDQSTRPMWDHQVLYYRASGELLGAARLYSDLFLRDWNHTLAFGEDGSVYQLLSLPDHSVQIVRLGFTSQLPPFTAAPTETPTLLATQLPSTSAATDEEHARNALIGFFANLSTGNYAEAAALFGGEVEDSFRPQEPGETLEDYWADICRFLWCLPVAEVTSVEQVAEDEYLFYVVFAHPEWGRFEIGACCGGDPAADPPVWQFAYPVKMIDGVWQVMRPPLLTP